MKGDRKKVFKILTNENTTATVIKYFICRFQQGGIDVRIDVNSKKAYYLRFVTVDLC